MLIFKVGTYVGKLVVGLEEGNLLGDLTGLEEGALLGFTVVGDVLG